MPLTFDTIAQSMLCLRKSKKRWLHSAFLMGFWCWVFVLLVGYLAQSEPHHTVSYIQPHGPVRTSCQLTVSHGWCGFIEGWIHHEHIYSTWWLELHSSHDPCQCTCSTKGCEVWRGLWNGCMSTPLRTWTLEDGFWDKIRLPESLVWRFEDLGFCDE